MERFLLDQIDGSSDIHALSDATMIDAVALRRMLVHLASLGVIMFTTTVAVAQSANAAPTPDADIDKTRAARIDHVATHLSTATHYELLGVPPDADKAAFKKAYFALSKEFHPDTQHGKKIGGYRAKMEAIFKRVTDAHDVLSRPKRKTEYDEELARTKRAPFVTVLHPPLEDAPPKARSEATGVQATAVESTTRTPTPEAGASSPLGAPRAFAPPSPPSPPRAPGTTGPASVSVGRPAAPAAPTVPGSPPPPSASGLRAPIAPSGTSPGVVPSPSVPRPPMPGSPSSPGAPIVGATSGIRLPASVAVPRPQPPGATVQAPLTPPVNSLRAPLLGGAPRPGMGNPPSGSSLRPPSTPGTARPVVVPGAGSNPGAARPGVGGSSAGDVRAPISSGQADRIARDLARQTGNAPISSTPPTRPDADAINAAERERSLKRALHGASQLTGAVDRIALYERQALQLEVAGDLHGALSCLRAALQFDASRADLRATHDRLDRMVAAHDVEANRTRARNEEKAGRHTQAFAAWARVVLGAPSDTEALGSAARCCLEGGLDLRQARDFAQRLVDLRPDDVDPRILLARIFRSAGMRLNAIRELEVAAKLDPGNQLVKNLQRELK